MEEKQNGRRSLSPYHEKCFPPYCDSAQQVDRAALSKMARGDLEEKYIIFADENLELKKQNRNHERQIQRLQTAIQRQDYLDKRSGKSPTSRVIDSNQIANLEAQNRNLQAKVKVLKQQLMNHSFIHSKDSRIAEAKKQGKSPRESSEYQTPTQTQSAREAKPDRNVAALKIKVAELENALETQKNKYKARIAQLEKELTALEKEAGKSGISINEQLSETSRQVKDNTELIRLRMQAEKQAAELEELRGKLEAANAEIEKLRRELKDGKDRADDLENDLARERNKSRTALSEASKGTTHMETIRALEEQIRDLQKERDTLKDTNEKLLQLTQSKSEKSLVKATSGHDIIIAQLERSLKDKMKELEEKEARIRELEQTPNQENVTYQTIAQLELSLKDKMKELEEKDARIRELEQTPNQEKVTYETIAQLELSLKDKMKELEEKEARIRELEQTPNQENVTYQTIAQLERSLKVKIEELEEKEARIRELEQTPNQEKVTCQAQASGSSLNLESRSHNNKTLKEIKPLHQQFGSVNFTIQKYWQNVKIQKALTVISRQVAQLSENVVECGGCNTLKRQLCGALIDNQRLQEALEDTQVGKVRSRSPLTDSSNTSPYSMHRSKSSVENFVDWDDSLYDQYSCLGDGTELNNLRYELERSRDEVSRLRDMVERLRDENDRVRGENKRMEIQLYDAIKELDMLRTKTAEYESELNKLREEVEWFREEVKKLLGMLERLRDENDRVKGENKRMEIQLFDAIKELDILRPIAAEHESCKRPPPPQTSSKSIQYLPPSVVSFKEPQNTTVEQHPSVHSQCSVRSQNRLDNERYIALTRQLQETLWENEKIKKKLAGRSNDDFLKKQNQRLEDELTRALQELRELRPIVEEHRRCGDKIPPRKEMIVPEFCREYVKEVAPAPVYQISKVLSKASSHPSKPITPVQSKIKNETRKKKWPDAKSVVLNDRREEIQLESTEIKLPDDKLESYLKTDKGLKEENIVLPVENSESLEEVSPDSQLKKQSSITEGVSRYPSKNNENSKRKSDTRLKAAESMEGEDLGQEKTQYMSENNEIQKETNPLTQFTTDEDSEEAMSQSEAKNNEDLKEVKTKDSPFQLEDIDGDKKKLPLTSTLVNVKRLLRRRTPLRPTTPPYSLEKSSPLPKKEEEAPSAYISHVTPPPSTHCLETMKVNDEQQRANMLIVSKHDFENVLMQKKRYSTEVEMVEPIDGQQVLNCKMEICMYDLDLQDGMVEYLSSIEKEPKVYVEWSFVGLDQRTAPLPANQALFYTNVMYFGPLSSEIKNYLNKVEMPIYLYLVKSSGPPMRVAQGTLDILPAMEQPNRGFMRSVFLQGVDIPNRYSNNKSVGAIHCSFILHECCLGDPPFRDQLEVAIGTLYLKNRDGGIVPDHATHIYIEYALLGHCGPDLETDSVPRGEVMKFNHSKKLRVNDENAQHLKAMLEDENPRPLRFTVLAEPCNLLSESEVETVGHADVNLNEQMIRRNQDLISSQVPVYSNEGEHLGTLSVTVLGVGTLQQLYADRQR